MTKCVSTTKNSTPCTRNEVINGYCKQHFKLQTSETKIDISGGIQVLITETKLDSVSETKLDSVSETKLDSIPQIILTPEDLNEWFPILPNFSKYMINKRGEVKNKKGKHMKPRIDENGYLRYSLVNDQKIKIHITAHRLTAITFIPNPDNKPIVDHIDRSKQNNMVNNLRWATIVESNRNRDTKGLINKGSSKKVFQLDMDGNFIKEWNSSAEACRELNDAEGLQLSTSRISLVCLGKAKSSGGYIWAHKEYDKIDGEIWKEVKLDEGNFEVSSHGRVKTMMGYVSYGSLSCGYMNIQLGTDRKHYAVHRLVCMAFNYHEDWEYLEANHIDGNKTNNHFTNLEFLTGSENCIKAVQTGLKTYDTMNKKVDQYTKDGAFIKSFPSIAEAHRETSASRSGIVGVCEKKINHNTAGGYIWKYTGQ